MSSRKNQPAVARIDTRVLGLALALVLLSCGVATPQTKRRRKARSSPPPTRLTAREIARRSLQSVVVLVGRDEKGKAVTLGTGFFVTSRIIATNYHVIEYASGASAKLLTGDDTKYEIDGTVAVNEKDDLVLLQVGAGVGPRADPYLVPLGHPLSLARGSQVDIGDQVYVVGNPEGFEGTFSQGIVSALRGYEYIQKTRHRYHLVAAVVRY